MERYVVNRDLSEKLKEAGYPQNISQFVHMPGSKAIFSYMLAEADGVEGWFACPLSDELFEQLPIKLNSVNSRMQEGRLYLCPTRHGEKWLASYGDDDGTVVRRKKADAPSNNPRYMFMVQASEDTPVNALAKLWILCKENGLLEGKQ